MFWFPLNRTDASIVDGDHIDIGNVFRLKVREKDPADLELFSDSIIFLDGYDEIFLELQHTNRCKTISQFVSYVSDLARDYNMRIIITSRSSCLNKDELERLSIPVLKLDPLSDSQQSDWIQAHAPDYLPVFQEKILSNDHLKELAGVPLLFRMIVYCRFAESASNQTELYDKLFDNLMRHRELSDDEIFNLRCSYEHLAYRIWTYNDESTQEEHTANTLRLMVHFALNETRVETEDKPLHYYQFVHRSFYQYFLAHYFYRQLKRACSSKNSEGLDAFLKELYARRLDQDVAGFFENLSNIKQQAFQSVLNRLAETNAIFQIAAREDVVNPPPPFERCQNAFCNTLTPACTCRSSG